jgi:hypothetical protein
MLILGQVIDERGGEDVGPFEHVNCGCLVDCLRVLFLLTASLVLFFYATVGLFDCRVERFLERIAPLFGRFFAQLSFV